MEKIIALSKSRPFDHSQKMVNNFWLRNSQTATSANEKLPLELLAQSLQDWQAKAKVVCIASEELASPSLVKWCLSMTEGGTRVYLLTSKRPADAAQLAGCCLLRFELPLKGSFLIVDPQEKADGLFFSGSLTDSALADGNLQALRMDGAQSLEAYGFFAYHFWNTAKSEILDRSAKSIACKPAGFSVQQPMDCVGSCASMFSADEVSHASFPSSQWNLDGLSGATLVTDIQLKNPEKIGDQNELAVNVAYNGLHCICSDEEGYLFSSAAWSKEDVHFGLELNGVQRRQLVAEIKDRYQQAEYAFVVSDSRQALVGKKVRLLGTANDQLISASNKVPRIVSAPSFLALQELEKLEPPFEDDGFSCRITYEWTILPFALPIGASEDPLYQKWKDKQANFLQRISETQRVIDKAEEKSKGFVGGWMRFVTQALLGKSQKWEDLRTLLAAFAGTELQGRSTAERKKIVERFNEIQKEAAHSVIELDQKVEEAKQQEEWEGKRKVLVEEVANLEQQVTSASDGIQQKESSFEAERAALRAKFEVWLKAKNIAEDDLPKQRSNWEKASGKENRKKNPKEAEEAKQLLDALIALEPKILSQRHAGDMKKLDEEKRQLEIRFQKKKADLEKMGDQFRPSGQSGGGSLIDGLQGKGGSGAPSNFRPFPDDFPEDLPVKGTLHAAGGKRYLAITFWQEEEKGRMEADRLKAILCVNSEN